MRWHLKRTLMILLGYIFCLFLGTLLCGTSDFSVILPQNAKPMPELRTSEQDGVVNFFNWGSSVIPAHSRKWLQSVKRDGRLDNVKTDKSNNLGNTVRLNMSSGEKTVQEKQAVTVGNVTVRPDRCNGCFHSDFPMLLDQPDLCKLYGKQTIDVLFLIITDYQKANRREAIRQTWASATRNNTSNFRHVFLFGNTRRVGLQQQVKNESALYQDVLVSDFRDSYRNLTLKTLMGLRWAVTRCRHARFFMKVDDDVWVSPMALTELLAEKGDLLKDRIGGHCQSNVPVLRDPGNKWHATYQEYPNSTYPPYCGGPAYIGGMDVAESVVNVSKDVPFFVMEDVYVGMCLQATGLKTAKIGRIHTLPDTGGPICVIKNVVVAQHRIYPTTLKLIWEAKCNGTKEITPETPQAQSRANKTLTV